mmetsp:Transcript_22864/g.67486  ORF Transcript_22864/g.67486 Transcript_22864/m.67486 type:complete len:403 (-) Transcript_22864:263-1471(-)
MLILDQGILQRGSRYLLYVLHPFAVILEQIDRNGAQFDVHAVEFSLQLSGASQFGRAHGREILGMREEHPPRISQILVEFDETPRGLGREIRSLVADAHVRLLLDRHGVSVGIVVVEFRLGDADVVAVGTSVAVRIVQILVGLLCLSHDLKEFRPRRFPVLALGRLPQYLPVAEEGESSVGRLAYRKIETEGRVVEEFLLLRARLSSVNVVPVGEAVVLLDHVDVPLEDVPKDPQRVVRGQLLLQLEIIVVAHMLIFHVLRVGQIQQQKYHLLRLELLGHARRHGPLDVRGAHLVARVHPLGAAEHVPTELIQQYDQRDDHARLLDGVRPMLVHARGRDRHVLAKIRPYAIVGLLRFAEPQIQAVLHAVQNHELADRFGLGDLAAADLAILHDVKEGVLDLG